MYLRGAGGVAQDYAQALALYQATARCSAELWRGAVQPGPHVRQIRAVRARQYILACCRRRCAGLRPSSCVASGISSMQRRTLARRSTAWATCTAKALALLNSGAAARLAVKSCWLTAHHELAPLLSPHFVQLLDLQRKNNSLSRAQATTVKVSVTVPVLSRHCRGSFGDHLDDSHTRFLVVLYQSNRLCTSCSIVINCHCLQSLSSRCRAAVPQRFGFSTALLPLQR